MKCNVTIFTTTKNGLSNGTQIPKLRRLLI